jgi:hypothetical protein
MKQTTWPGNWKVSCHVCGFWYPSSEIKKRWDGALTCPKDYESRHPQTLIKVRGERAFPSFVSTDGPEIDVFFCTLQTASPYAGMGAAGCMQAGPYLRTYQFLLDLDGNGHGPGTFKNTFP